MILDHGVDLDHFSQPSRTTPEPIAELREPDFQSFSLPDSSMSELTLHC